MAILPFGEYRPDVSDYEANYTKSITNVFPRADGYGPVNSLTNYTGTLRAACRGIFFAKKNDNSIQVFAGTSDRLFTLNNTDQSWTPCSKVTAVTSISNASPAVVSYTSHGFVAGDKVVFSTTDTLPAPLSAGTVYYVISSGLTTDAFEISTSSGGSAVNTTSAGSGTHSVTSLYSALSSDANWDFVQFNNFVIAVQQNVAPQVYDLTSSSQFADLGGSPPQAAHVSVVNRFLVLSGLAAPNVYRVHWSGLNATTTWTSGVSQSDYQDLPTGGIVRGVAGGELGVIFQDTSIRRMIYAPGSQYVFGIDVISADDGLVAPWSLIQSQDKIFYLSRQGFKMLTPGSYPVPIGKERVDRTFFKDYDASQPQLMIGSADPRSTRVFWAYKSVNGTSGYFDKILCYDWGIDKWSPIVDSGEFIASLAIPGLTLDSVDSAYGSNIDTLTIGSFDDISTAAYSFLAGVDSNNSLGYFTGNNLEATMQTSEHSADGRRVYVNGFRPVSDADSVYGSVDYRDKLSGTASTSSETFINSQDTCPQRVSSRYARANVRIPASTNWTYATGVEPDIVVDGKR